MTGPACLITGEVSPYRREPFRLLAAAEDVEVVTWRPRGEPVPGLTIRETNQVGAVRLAASGRYRAVICGRRSCGSSDRKKTAVSNGSGGSVATLTR